MKIEKIEVSFTKNLGNYESLKVGAEFTPDHDKSDEQNAIEADKQIRAMVDAIIAERNKPKEPRLRQKPQTIVVNPKPIDGSSTILTLDHPRFNGVVNALKTKRADFGDVKRVFSIIDESVIEYLQQNNLI